MTIDGEGPCFYLIRDGYAICFRNPVARIGDNMPRFNLILIISITSILFVSTSPGQEILSGKYANQPQNQTIVRIASVSVFPEKWNKQTNWDRIEIMVRKAVTDYQPHLVVTPEGVLEGYVINEVNGEKDPDKKAQLVENFKELGEPLDGPSIQKAMKLADELNIFFVLGFLERRGENLFNSAILIDSEGDMIGRYSKTHFAQGYEINPSCYQTGDDYPVFDTPFGKVGILICYDRQLPEPARILALRGAQILLVPSYGSHDDGTGWNTMLLRTRAYENRCPLVFTHPEQSLLISRKGGLEKIGQRDEAVWYEIDTSPGQYKDRFRNRRPETYTPLIER